MHDILLQPEANILLRIVVAIILGCLIGIEREIWNKSAGLRTHILVCLGSTVFTLLSIYGFTPYHLFPQLANVAGVVKLQNDPARIAAQILTGIGFIGGGAVLHHGNSVYGLTTAASLWITASIGMAVGTGSYTIAIAATLIALLVLGIVGKIERGVFARRRVNTLKRIKVTIVCSNEEVASVQESIYSEFSDIIQMAITSTAKDADLLKISFIVTVNQDKAIKAVYEKIKSNINLDQMIIQQLSDS